MSWFYLCQDPKFFTFEYFLKIILNRINPVGEKQSILFTFVVTKSIHPYV